MAPTRYNDLRVTYKVNIKDGVLVWNSDVLKQLRSQLKFFPDCDCKLEICVYDERKEKEKLRTEAQNRYYHKLLDVICDYTGDTHMDMHDKLKVKFLGRPYVMDDKEYIIVKSTTELNTKTFTEYLEKIFHWASEELELRLPDASEYY